MIVYKKNNKTNYSKICRHKFSTYVLTIFISVMVGNSILRGKNDEIIKLKKILNEGGEKCPSTKTFADIYMKCLPLTVQESKGLEKEIKAYENSTKFHNKILEAKGEVPATSNHHGSIMKYLKENVLEKGWSILDLGAAAGGMLRYTMDAYNELERLKGPRGKFRGVELVTGWVNFANDYFNDKEKYGDFEIIEGDITNFSFEDDTTATFDFVMLNDVIEHLQINRYGCFFKKLQDVTHDGSVVYMHTPTPETQLSDSAQFYENVLPHHILISGMAEAGFQLMHFEHDKDTRCGGVKSKVPLQIRGGKCYTGGWLRYYHATFVRKENTKIFELH